MDKTKVKPNVNEMIREVNDCPLCAKYPKIDKTTLNSMKNTEKGKNLIYCKDIDDMFKKLNS